MTTTDPDLAVQLAEMPGPRYRIEPAVFGPYRRSRLRALFSFLFRR